MNALLLRLYKNAEFGLGIKPYVTRFFVWLYDVSHSTWTPLHYWFDNYLIATLSESLQRYLYHRTKQHYGADYRWGDERSQNLDTKTCNYGYGLLQYAIVRNQSPQSVLCIGSMYGYIPFMLAKACEDNQRGHVYFVDAGYDIAKYEDKDTHFFGQGFWKKQDAYRQFHYLLKDPKKYISLFVLTSEAFATRHPNLMFDHIYLDGDHSYGGVKRDVGLFWDRLRLGGYLVFHDISYDRPDSKIQIDMKKIWQNITKNPRLSQKIDFTNNYSGLGIIKKTDSYRPI